MAPRWNARPIIRARKYLLVFRAIAKAGNTPGLGSRGLAPRFRLLTRIYPTYLRAGLIMPALAHRILLSLWFQGNTRGVEEGAVTAALSRLGVLTIYPMRRYTMNIHHTLSMAWREAVASGRLVNEFEAASGDPAGRWAPGDRVRFGLTCTADTIEYAAWNLRSGQQIEAPVVERKVGSTNFVCQFNRYRALRPGAAGQGGEQRPDISPAPADCRFHCQDPTKSLSLLQRKPLLQVRLAHAHWNAYYNAAPIEKTGHFLWVPVTIDASTTVIPHIPQRLSRKFIEDLVLLFRYSAPSIVLFNALHAGASVNHIHAQAVFHTRRLPVEDARTVEYKGFTLVDGYPAQALSFRVDADVSALAASVERLQQHGIAFNLMLLGEQAFLFPRDARHEVVSEFPGGVLATLDLAGKLITDDRQAYERTGAAQIESAFGKATLSAKQLIDGWEAAESHQQNR